jgi:hypothetical protein
MLDTYIKNRGTTKTIVHNNNKNVINETNWDADYDGNTANISVDSSKNGKNQHFDFKLTKDDLANILTIPSINQSIDKRLIQDFKQPEIEDVFLDLIPNSSKDFSIILEPARELKPTREKRKKIKRNIPIQDFLTHISSPKSNEEFIIPFKDNNLMSEQPIYKIIHKPSSRRSHSSRRSPKRRSHSSRRSPKSSSRKRKSSTRKTRR